MLRLLLKPRPSYPLDRRFMAASRITFRAFRYVRRIFGANTASSTMTPKDMTSPVSIACPADLRNRALNNIRPGSCPSHGRTSPGLTSLARELTLCEDWLEARTSWTLACSPAPFAPWVGRPTQAVGFSLSFWQHEVRPAERPRCLSCLHGTRCTEAIHHSELPPPSS